MSELAVSLNEATNLCYTFEFVPSQRKRCFLLRGNNQKEKHVLNMYVLWGIKHPGLHGIKFSLKIPLPLARRSMIHNRIRTPSASDSQDCDLTAGEEKQSGNQAMFLLFSQPLEAAQHFLAPFSHALHYLCYLCIKSGCWGRGISICFQHHHWILGRYGTNRREPLPASPPWSFWPSTQAFKCKYPTEVTGKVSEAGVTEQGFRGRSSRNHIFLHF